MFPFVSVDAVAEEQRDFLYEVVRQRDALESFSEKDVRKMARALNQARKTSPSHVFLSRDLQFTTGIGIYVFDNAKATPAVRNAMSILLAQTKRVEEVLAFHLKACARQLVALWKEKERKGGEKERLFLEVSEGSAKLTTKTLSSRICIVCSPPPALPEEDLLKQAALVIMASLRRYLKWTFFSSISS